MAKSKAIKCYFCGQIVERDNQLVEKKIPMATKTGVRNYRRQFHMDCLPKYVNGREDKELMSQENSDWDAVYQYFRKSILGLPETTPLEQHITKRLLGLRLGQYYPSGNNTRILPRGYDFKTILMTMKVCNPKIQRYINNARFTDSKHKTDAIMRFITGEINDVAQRLKAQQRENEKLEKIEIETVEYKKEYKRKGDNGMNKDIQSLFGGLL